MTYKTLLEKTQKIQKNAELLSDEMENASYLAVRKEKTMAKTYEVKVDVVMSGSFYIEADSPEEAERIAKDKSVVASDLRHFYCNRIDTLDATECEE